MTSPMHSRLLTLTTDFGTRDAYVAAMKAAIFGTVGGAIQILDISHEIAPQDVMEAAFVLGTVLPGLPPDSVNVIVVDPGVGSPRRAIAARADGRFFVCPDNGVLPLLLDGRRPDRIVELDKPGRWRQGVAPSATFHGRDIFAPIAAQLAAGAALEDVGTPIESIQPLHWALPIVDAQGVRGWIVHVDRFGNCITNITVGTLADLPPERMRDCKLYVGNSRLEGIRRTYSDVAAGEPLALVGSAGFVEVAVNAGSAAALLGIAKGSPVNLVFSSERSADNARTAAGDSFARLRPSTTSN